MPHVDASPFELVRVFRLARKELREILRDRRTIVTLIAMPVLLYPLMSVAFQQFALASRASKTAPEYRIGALTTAESSLFDWHFLKAQEAWLRVHKPAPDRPRPRRASINSQGVGRRIRTQEDRDAGLEVLKEMLRESLIDLAVVIPNLNEQDDPTHAPHVDRLYDCTIYAMADSPMARQALAQIDSSFAALNEEYLKKRLGLPDVKPRIRVFTVQRVMLKSAAGDGFISLDALVPLILILMTITGAVYPAIDLTAGEHERGTLEILVATPVPRFELLSAKYLAVVTVAVLNAIVNLICMAITVTWSGLGPALISGGLSFVLLLQVFALLLLFAFFFSAVLLCLTSMARSFKEAQAYLIPLMLASLTPGIMAMMPGLELTGILKVLPLVNVVLLARDLFGSGTDVATALTVILTTMLYAFAALSLAARVFGAESVLYSEQSSWSDLFRRPDEPQPAATIPAALWCLALMLPIQFALLGLVRLLAPEPVAAVALQVAVVVLMFGLLPAWFMYLGRVDTHTGLGLAPPRPAAVLAALLLGASLWPLELWLLAQGEISLSMQEGTGAVLENLKTARNAVGWGVLALVIVPAILEEFFFRGMLFQAFRQRLSVWLTIGLSALLFGVAHVALGGALGLERLLPSMVLGLILSTVCWHTGSLWPSMIQHVCHNTILLVIGLKSFGDLKEISWPWLAASAIGALAGLALLCLWGGRRSA